MCTQPDLRTLYLFVRWLDSRHEDPVPVYKLHKGVADGISGAAYPNGLHHTRVPQLTHAQLPIEQLWTERRRWEVPSNSVILESIFKL